MGFLVQHGRAMRLIRPASRRIRQAPVVPLQQVSYPPPELLQPRPAHSAHRKCGSRYTAQSWKESFLFMIYLESMGQAIAPTMLRAGGHVVHSRGDGSSSPSSGYCFVHQDMRALQKSYAHFREFFTLTRFFLRDILIPNEIIRKEF